MCASHFSICALRHQDVPTRSRYVRLVDSVRDNGGNVRCLFYFLISQSGSLYSSFNLDEPKYVFFFTAEYSQVFTCPVNVSENPSIHFQYGLHIASHGKCFGSHGKEKTHTHQTSTPGLESNLQPFCCLATVLTTAPPWYRIKRKIKQIYTVLSYC